MEFCLAKEYKTRK